LSVWKLVLPVVPEFGSLHFKAVSFFGRAGSAEEVSKGHALGPAFEVSRRYIVLDSRIGPGQSKAVMVFIGQEVR